MNKLIKYSLVTVAVIVVIYLAGVVFFLNRFTGGSQFGTISLTGKTLAEAEVLIESELDKRQVELVENGQSIATVQLSELRPKYQISEAIAAVYQQEDAAWWPLSFFEKHQVTITPQMVVVDNAQAQSVLTAKGIDNTRRQAPTNAEIQYSDQTGYTIKPDTKGTQVDASVLGQQMLLAATQDQGKVDLASAYAAAEVTATSDKVTTAMSNIKQVSENPVTLVVADEELTIPTKTIESWMTFDANNQITLDKEQMTAYLEALNEKYATFDKEREFNSTLQGKVKVPAGILGWKIDVENTVTQLEEDILARKPVKREPVIYSTGGVPNAKNDIGNTYVEVDVTHQRMFLYVDGKMLVDSPIVTGQPGAETKPGAGAVIEMLSGTNLVGYNQFYRKSYSVPVNFWMRFDHDAQGIHDAPWQSSFGGDTWTYSGSLGCVNTPYEEAAEIYNHVTYGTPVVVFY